MLRISLGMTRIDKIKNESEFEETKFEARLRWFGIVQMRYSGSIRQRILMELPGRSTCKIPGFSEGGHGEG